jgi:hypothetical protein
MNRLLLMSILFSGFALSQTPDPTPLDGRISGTVLGADNKPISAATVSFVEQSALSITSAYPRQVKADSRGHFDSGATLKHAIYDVYAHSEKDDYPDRTLVFYRSADFHPETVQLFGAQPEAKVEIKLEHKAGVLTGSVIDADTDQPLDASVSLVNMQLEDTPYGMNGKSAHAKQGKFRVLVPENTGVHVFVLKPTPPNEPEWSGFDVTVHLQPGETRNLDIRLYKAGTP